MGMGVLIERVLSSGVKIECGVWPTRTRTHYFVEANQTTELYRVTRPILSLTLLPLLSPSSLITHLIVVSIVMWVSLSLKSFLLGHQAIIFTTLIQIRILALCVLSVCVLSVCLVCASCVLSVCLVCA